jgi:hypothetical protein
MKASIVIATLISSCGSKDHAPSVAGLSGHGSASPMVSDSIELANCKASSRTFHISIDEASTGQTCPHPKQAFAAPDVCAWGEALKQQFPSAQVRLFTNVSLFAVEGLIDNALGLAKEGVQMRVFADYKSNVRSFESNGEYKTFCVEERSPNQYELRLVIWSVP